jgi:aspartate aminotransferase
MRISQIAETIQASPTLALNAKAAMLRERGEPVVHLGGGEPKSKAPADAIQAATALLSTGEVRYTPADGIPALKKAIVRYTEEHYNRSVAAANVMASAGAKQAIMVALQTALDPGDEVIFPVPYWVSYPDMVRLCGAVAVPVRPGDGGFEPRLVDIEARVGPRTRVVIINSPNNPSGAMYSEGFICDIVQFCEKRGLFLIMDDIYHRLVFDGRTAPSPFAYAKKPIDESMLIAVNGVSKQYAMTGFRIGWAVGNQKLIEVMGNIQGHQTSGPSAVGQAAAVAAINGAQSSVDDLRATLENNRNVMVSMLKSLNRTRFAVPDGTFYCFADFSAYEKSSHKLAQYLIEKVQVLTVPGVEFGVDGFLRLSYCGSSEDIKEGVRRIKWALDPDSPDELTIGSRRVVRDRGLGSTSG